ncbi:MAG: glycine cleavage system aminomethyltransferase GcvT [Prolixibacteraceae bacterium]|nr:glycine cleavage system aminomethyltransferase GcvT [Prolixibacteraceae bacterium]
MKRTPFYSKHTGAGAKMLPFAGYEMPIEYVGIKKEHMAVRNAVGVFDVSHMGEIWIKGDNALQFLQKITSNDVEKLVPGQAQYTCMPNESGGIVDDLLVYFFEPGKYLLVVNASNIEKDYAWMLKHNKVGAEIENVSDSIAQLAVQGPKAVEVLQQLTDVDLSAVRFYNFTVGEFAGIDDVIISATGYTGAGGFELYFKNDDAQVVWNEVFNAGATYGIMPVGLGARDTLRLEMGYCLYGNDLTDETSPIEAGLGWITKFTETKNFISKELLLKQKQDGVQRRLRGFIMLDRGIPRHAYEITDADGNPIGEVTSGSISPVLEKGIGMGYIDKKYSAFETIVYIKVRNKLLKAEVVKMPFIKN